MVTSFAMLEMWGKTPVDLGVASWDEVDTWWFDAMIEIKGGHSTQLAADMKRR